MAAAAGRRGRAPAARRCSRQPRAVIQPVEAVLLEMSVELGEARSRRDRDQEVAPGIADQALDLALVVAFAGPAEAVEEQVVRLQLGKGPGPLPLAAIQDAGHRQLGVVVEDRARHPTKKAKAALCPSRKASIRSAG